MSEAEHNGDRVLPKHAEFHFMASDADVQTYYFPEPWSDRQAVFCAKAPSVEMAKQSMADEFQGVAPEEIPDPSESREAAVERYEDGFDWPGLHEMDIWRLAWDFERSDAERRWQQAHQRPTKTTIERVLLEWDDVEDIPLGDPEALQQADGIGPVRATRFAGAAAADRLVDRVADDRRVDR